MTWLLCGNPKHSCQHGRLRVLNMLAEHNIKSGPKRIVLVHMPSLVSRSRQFDKFSASDSLYGQLPPCEGSSPQYICHCQQDDTPMAQVCIRSSRSQTLSVQHCQECCLLETLHMLSDKTKHPITPDPKSNNQSSMLCFYRMKRQGTTVFDIDTCQLIRGSWSPTKVN